MHSVAVVITTFKNPGRLSQLLENMEWAGVPEIPVYVFEDRAPSADWVDWHVRNAEVCDRFKWVSRFETTPKWGCMHGVIEYAMQHTEERWIIYVPDDVAFTRGGLLQEHAAALAYGRDFVGAIQAPYWNADELHQMGVVRRLDEPFETASVVHVPRNTHWDNGGIPRIYINVNGAGFTLNRDVFEEMGRVWPKSTWRLDEWFAWKVWNSGRVCLTVPGPPRVHRMGGATHLMPKGLKFSSVEGWMEATGGLDPTATGMRTREIMHRLPGEDWVSVYRFFSAGGSIG